MGELVVTPESGTAEDLEAHQAHSWGRRILRVLTLRAGIHRELASDRKAGWQAIATTVLSAVAVSGFLALNPSNGFSPIYATVSWSVGLLIWTGVVFLMSLPRSREVGYAGLLRCIGFVPAAAVVPSLIVSLVGAIDLGTGEEQATVVYFVLGMTWVWVLWIQVQAVREAVQVSKVRAAVAVVVPFLAFLGLLVFLAWVLAQAMMLTY